MNLLVTGGAGFISSNFIRYWLEHYPNDRVVNLDLLTYAGNLSSLGDIAMRYARRVSSARLHGCTHSQIKIRFVKHAGLRLGLRPTCTIRLKP